jgi:hypothetical protein
MQYASTTHSAAGLIVLALVLALPLPAWTKQPKPAKEDPDARIERMDKKATEDEAKARQDREERAARTREAQARRAEKAERQREREQAGKAHAEERSQEKQPGKIVPEQQADEKLRPAQPAKTPSHGTPRSTTAKPSPEQRQAEIDAGAAKRKADREAREAYLREQAVQRDEERKAREEQRAQNPPPPLNKERAGLP